MSQSLGYELCSYEGIIGAYLSLFNLTLDTILAALVLEFPDRLEG